MNIRISSIICTHNRAAYLTKAIQSLVDQHTPRDNYEIIIVDNCSTDSTKEVVKKFSGVNNIRYIHESTLGLSFARNTGWRNAKGEYVAYLDDDAIACPDWLNKILEVFETLTPMPGCVGGKTEPLWEAPRPKWLSDDLVTGLTAIDWSDIPHAITDLDQQWLVGANIAFPSEVLRRIGGFVSGLDRIGKNLLSGGDIFLEKQILKAGYTCFYHPEIIVSHLVPKSRLDKRWFIKRYYSQGFSDAVMVLIEESPSHLRRLGMAISKIFSLLQSPEKIINLIWSGNDARQFTEKCFTMITVGHIVGLLNTQHRQDS